MKEKRIRGIAASPGIAIGPVYRYEPTLVRVEAETCQDVSAELARLETALAEARQELRLLAEQASKSVGPNEAAIFSAHEVFLQDPELLQQVQQRIRQRQSAAFAWQEGFRYYIHQLGAIQDEYLQARVLDLEDVAQRVLRHLTGQSEQSLQLSTPAVIVARELTPSALVRCPRELVLALCTAQGGPTSHVAILARALGVPAVVGLGESATALRSGQVVIVDGEQGLIVAEPGEGELTLYRQRRLRLQEQAKRAEQSRLQPACTRDGHSYPVRANIQAPEEVAEARACGAEGIGLLRTEFLFLERSQAPTEDEQLEIYRAIIEAMRPAPVVIRTFDIGGDKPAPYLSLPSESNPFLGVRGVRLGLKYPALLRTQLRALLRAGAGHELRILFPMVSSYEEAEALRQLTRAVQEELRQQGQPLAERIELGIMIEVPAAALLTEAFAEVVDFFSLGTNDLTQYTLAADRTNESTAPLADPFHPAVLRLLQLTIEAAHRRQRRVEICGELAAEPLAIPLLLGLGIDELSMVPRAIPGCKQVIRRWAESEARQIALHALQMRTAAEVRSYLRACSPDELTAKEDGGSEAERA
ncbi:phosphoenolpyruvate--protein phosphotransferase [Thermogemmatispora sp.]|uniref:phosphoenolpyruvate--protein phosphotransferase n=1 Tax=Thermogemmatispora sp. TaxID=1968838 RepID=UPI001DC2A462|nr:phosphoenolpyruvate--protein phosphotransferase [Thermogemmatispora sp.]MBX5449844.1 phosphoenolpyruvate--protein phosphotransferase [Thermogemmatispora sp.]